LLLAAIVESSEDAILTMDLNGIISSWNASAESFFGYKADEIIGQPVLRLVPPERKEEEEQILEQIKLNQPVSQFETIRLRKDGKRIDVSLTVSPVKDSTDRLTGASKIVRDISQRRQAEAEILSISRFPSENPNPVLRVTQEGKILYANRAGMEFLKPWERGVGQMLPQELQGDIRQAFETNMKIEVEIGSLDKIFSCTLSPIQSAGYVNIYCLSR
jgi:PAS domain S-box-containing protein